MRPTRGVAIGTLVVMLLIVLVACANQDTEQPGTDQSITNVPPTDVPRTPKASTTPGDHTGLIRGTITRPPGRDPRSGHSAAAPAPVSGDSIRAYDSSGRVAASTVSNAAGAFELVLPVGTYRLVEDICGRSQHVVVHNRATTQVKLTLPDAC